MKKIVAVFILIISNLFAYNMLTLIDTPTSDTLLRGYYNVYFSSYEQGGIKLKVAIGLSDRITLGISEDIGGAIGDNNVSWNIPGVLAKINIFTYNEKKFGWALGYDNLYEGEYGKVTIIETNQEGEISSHREIIYGFYTVFSYPVNLFGQQLFSFGARYPILPLKIQKTAVDLQFFANLAFSFNPELKINLELENIGISSLDRNKLISNASITYIAGDVLSVSLIFRYSFSDELNPSKNPSRSITIEYQNLFY